jgi:hypothetical protein
MYAARLPSEAETAINASTAETPWAARKTIFLSDDEQCEIWNEVEDKEHDLEEPEE